MSKVYIEAYGYHVETLYPYIVSGSSKDDMVLFDTKMSGASVIDSLEIQKKHFGIVSLVATLWHMRPEEIHINSVSMNLYISSWHLFRRAALLIITPYIAKFLFGCKIYGIVHESDQFYPVDVPVGRRHYIFQKLFGWLHIKLFTKVYVLAPEVKKYLDQYASNIELLLTTPLQDLAVNATAYENGSQRTIAWIGSINDDRRDWKPLQSLKSSLFERYGLTLDFICDSRSSSGPDCIKDLSARGLAKYLKTRDYRPSDVELFSAVKASSLILCLYGNNSYGKTKTSGARHIALAFEKDFLASTSDGFQLIDVNGNEVYQSSEMLEVLEYYFEHC